MTWGSTIATNTPSPMKSSVSPRGEMEEDATGDNEGNGEIFETEDMVMSTPEKPEKSGNSRSKILTSDSDQLPTPLICAVGALQRMTVKVPDKSNWRTLVLHSILLILSRLQTVELASEDEDMTDKVSLSDDIIHILATFLILFLSSLIT